MRKKLKGKLSLDRETIGVLTSDLDSILQAARGGEIVAGSSPDYRTCESCSCPVGCTVGTCRYPDNNG